MWYSSVFFSVSQTHFLGGGYRHSFQGQEKDDEIKGKGNSINYTYRMHDPRIGRFFALDPLGYKYPYNSPYAFSENRVLDGVELEGLEWQPVDASGNPVAIDDPNTTDYVWVGYTKLVAYTYEGVSYETYDEAKAAFVAAGGSPGFAAMAIGGEYVAADGTVANAEIWNNNTTKTIYSSDGGVPAKTAVDAVTIYVIRTDESASTGNTLGTMRVFTTGGIITGSTIEAPGPSTTVANQDKKVPAGTYGVKKNGSGKWGGFYSLYSDEVSASRGIEIHEGDDSDAWTEGCIVTGSTDENGKYKRDRSKVDHINAEIKLVGAENTRVIIIDATGNP